jgi:hypothetical protein
MTARRPTQLTDNNGAILPHVAMDDRMNVSMFGTSNVSIVGYAHAGALDGDAVWKIIYYIYNAAGDVVRTYHANGKNSYSHVWESAAIAVGIAITGASVAATCVITSIDHGLVTGDYIEIDSMAIGGMVEINSDGYGSKCFHITKLTDDTFSLQEAADPATDINSTGYAAYTTGGKFYKIESLNYTRG